MLPQGDADADGHFDGTCTLPSMVDDRNAAPAGFWLVTAGIFAVNAVVAAGNGMGLMTFFALVATVAALWAALSLIHI